MKVCLKWAVQKGILPVIKSENEGRLKENKESLNGLAEDCKDSAKLSSDDILTIDKLNKNQNIFMGWYDMLWVVYKNGNWCYVGFVFFETQVDSIHCTFQKIYL